MSTAVIHGESLGERHGQKLGTRQGTGFALALKRRAIMFEASWKKRSVHCPNCQGEKVRRSRRKGIGESLLHRLLFMSPYRCLDCHERFFRNRLFFTSMDTRDHGER